MKNGFLYGDERTQEYVALKAVRLAENHGFKEWIGWLCGGKPS
jgi:hypothetical protein